MLCNCITRLEAVYLQFLSRISPVTYIISALTTRSEPQGLRARSATRTPKHKMTTIDEEMIILDEDHAMQSIEPNGQTNNDVTVNPSKLLLNTVSPDLMSPGIPFHGHGDASKGFPAHSSPQPHLFKSSSPVDPDAMDIVPIKSTTVQVRIPPPPRLKQLPYPSKRTGLVYDDRMKFHAEPGDLEATAVVDIHPEDPRRIYEIFHEILEAGLVQESVDSDDEDSDDARDEKCWRIHTRHATRAEICLIHKPEHYTFIESLQGTKGQAQCERQLISYRQTGR